MIREFRADMYFLAKYHLRTIVTLLILCVGLYLWKTPSLELIAWYLPCLVLISSPQVITVLIGFAYGLGATVLSGQFEWMYTLGIPLGILLTFPFTGLLHCASHSSIRPKWLNRPVGELMGLIQLYGFADWTILHFVHHSYSDDPALDPHPPTDKPYWEFTKGMRNSAAKAFANYFFKQFGQTPASVLAAKRFSQAAKINTIVKLVFWFLLLGAPAFSFLYLTSVAFKMLHYAWLNHSTHRLVSKGEEILNLNHGWVYPVINRLSFGLYFHGNHHLAPSLFNPRYLDKRRSKVMPKEQELDVAV